MIPSPRKWLWLHLLLLASSALLGQANVSQQLVFAGLRSANAQGQVNAVAADAGGDIYLAFDQGDGVRVLKVSNDGTTLLAQAQLGAKGDSAIALVVDPAGNVYVAGTSTSGALSGTSGASMPNGIAGTTNSFVAKFNAALDEQWLTFTGGTQIAASSIAASADAVFIAGSAYGTDLPVTANGIEQGPAYGSVQNGFVERFSANGTTLVYATYVTGALGDTTLAGIAVDAGDDAWLVGSTTASGFATLNAVVPVMLSNPSGFAMQLTPAGDGIVWATFVPGTGLNAVALDSFGQTLLASGNVALGQFPVDTVASVLIPAAYQVLLRLSLDGSMVESGTLIAPGTQSTVTAAAGGAAWVGGSFGTGDAPLLPQPALATTGTGYAVRVQPISGIDQTVRFGGLADEQQTYASLPVQVNGLASDAAGELIAGGAAQPTASANLLATETYDLPLKSTPTAALPSAVTDAEVAAGNCGGSLCAGSAGYLAKVATVSAGPALTFSMGDLPFFVLRNLGSGAANGLQLTASSGSVSTNCGAALAPGAECDGLLSGGSVGSLTASAANVASETAAYGTYVAPPNAVVFYPKELDFGVQSSVSPAAVQTITVTNLGAASVTFTSGVAAGSANFSQASSDCALGASATQLVLAAGATCHIGVSFTASSSSANDGFVLGEWTVGSRQVMLTGYAQAAALSVSSSEVDFGTEFQGGLALPRYLYLSNASNAALQHTAVHLPAASPFTVTDGCPTTIGAGTVCRIRLDYGSATVPSTDSVTLALDQGLSVLVTGMMLPPPTVGGSTANPSLTVSPASATFADAVVVTGVSSATQTIGVMNSGTSAFALAIALTGDFIQQTSCGATLAAGATCAVAVQFAPSQPGLRQGLLTVTAGAGTAPLSVALSGTGMAILPSNNGTLGFPGVPVGQPLVQWYKVSQPFDRLTVAVAGPYRVTLVEDVGFGHGEPPSTSYVTSGTGTCHDCWVGVWFQPKSVGAQSGTLTFTSNPLGLPYVLTLTGSGIATTGLIVSPSLEAFGAVPVNSVSGASTVMLTNLNFGGGAITLAAQAVSGPFALAQDPQPDACGATLAYGASCEIEVGFTPSATGSANGTVMLTTSAGVVTVPLAGTGTADPGIAISPLALTFVNSGGSSATQQTMTLTNTGAATVQVGTPTVGTASFAVASQCGSLATGASCTVTVTFMPGSAPATDTLSIPVTSAGSGGGSQTATYTVALTGSYASASAGLEILPGTAEFGPTATLTQGSIRQFSVYNATANALALSVGLPRDFVLVGTGCAAVPANGSCSFSMQFAPLTNGDLPGTISVQGVPADGSATLTSLAYPEGYGVGTGALTDTGGLLVNGVFNFGAVAPGQTVSQTFTFANNDAPGAGPITVRRVTSGPPFLSTTTCGTAIPVGQSCTVTIGYTPTGQGSGDRGTLTVESDAQSSPEVIELSGQGASAGAAAAPVLATFSLSTGSLSFAATTVGDASATQTVTLTSTGDSTLQIASVTAPADFTIQNACTTVAAGAHCSFTVASTPQTTGLKLEALSIVSNAATSLEFISLIETGQAAALSFSPASLSFGDVSLGSTATLALTVTNTSANPITFFGVSATAGYSVGGTCPGAGGSLEAQASCTLQVTFAPASTGVLTGDVALSTSASTLLIEIPLTGTGVQSALTVTPSSLAFGSIAVGASAKLSLVLANHGTATITGLSLSVSGDYAITVPCPQATLAVGASCTVQVTFTPNALGEQNGTLTIVSSDPSSPLSIPLTGMGTTPAGFNLTVNGGSSASVTVASGAYATYSLAVTPVGGFTGGIALTCTPVQTVQYASCSLLPALVSVGAGTATSVATINTIESGSGVAGLRRNPDRTALTCLLGGLMLIFRRGRRLKRWIGQGLILTSLLCGVFLSGCGGSSPPASNNHDTPAGTYQFQVTANSTSGVQLTQTVTLNLVVTGQ